MKHTKKFLSVFLAVLMLCSAFSAGFAASAAWNDAKADTWAPLVAALKNREVADADYKLGTEVNDAGKITAYTMTVNDPTGKITTAFEAYWALLTKIRGTADKAAQSACYGSIFDGANASTKSSATLTLFARMTNATYGKMSTADFNNYKVHSVLNAFACGMPDNDALRLLFNYSSIVRTTEGLTTTYLAPKKTLLDPIPEFKVTIGGGADLFAYENIDALPANNKVDGGKTWTVTSRSAKTVGDYYVYIFRPPTAPVDAAVDISAIRAFDATWKNYAYLANYDFDQLVGVDSAVLNAAVDELTAGKAAVDELGAGVFAHFFPDVDLAALLGNIADALDTASYYTVVSKAAALLNEDYSAYKYDALVDLYERFNVANTAYAAASASEQVKAYVDARVLSETGVTVTAAKITDTMADIYAKAAALKLVDLKERIDAAVAEANGITNDDVTDGDPAAVELAALITKLNSLRGEINDSQYTDAAILTVFDGKSRADVTAAIDAAVAHVNTLVSISNDVAAFQAKYAEFLNDVKPTVAVDDSSAELLGAVKSEDTWYANLNTFIADLKSKYGEEFANKIFNELDTEMQNYLYSRYVVLDARVTAEVATAKELYTIIHEKYGDKVTFASLDTYGKLKSAIGFMEKDIIDFLLDGTNNYNALDPQVKTDYEWLSQIIFTDYDAFFINKGLDRFETTTVADIVRNVTDDDVVRDQDYTVNDAKLNDLIALLDEAIKSPEVLNLLRALLPAETDEDGNVVKESLIGETFSDTIDNVLKSVVFNDSFLNSLIGMVYPMLARELRKAWDENISGAIAAASSLTGITLQKAVGDLKVYMTPQAIAKNVLGSNTKYQQVYTKLNSISGDMDSVSVNKDGTDKVNPWTTNDNLYKPVIDEKTGKQRLDPVTGEPQKTLDLEWGITDKESFIDAATEAFAGIGVLLQLLLSNKAPSQLSYVLGALKINFSPNDGYNNAIAPILEGLGIDPSAIPNGRNFVNSNTKTATRNIIVNGLVNPIATLVDKLKAKPVDTLLGMLPTLSYAVTAQTIVPLLSYLETKLSYTVKVIFTIADDSIPINLGDMLNLDNILGIPVYENLTSLDGLVKLISAYLTKSKHLKELKDTEINLVLPHIDGAALASMGELTWHSSKRTKRQYNVGASGQAAYVVANKADVLQAILQYVFEVLNTPGSIESILDTLAKMKFDAYADPLPEIEPVTLPENILEIIAGIGKDPDSAIAAITELVFPQNPDKYDVDALYTEPDGMNWYQPEPAEEPETDEPAAEDTLVLAGYTAYWTKYKVDYILDNFDDFVDNVLVITGVQLEDENGEKVKVESLEQLIDILKKKYMKADMLNGLIDSVKPKLTETLDNLLATVAEKLPGVDVKDIVNRQIGVDIDALLDNLYFTFETGDFDGLKADLIRILTPLNSVLAFVLADQDITISVNSGETKVITLQGHDGYSDGIVPLLESLGAEGVVTSAEFLANPDKIAENLITPLFTVIEKFLGDGADVYGALLDTVPNVLYFLASDGVTTAVDSLLYPVFLALDTVRPLYDLNVNTLLNSVEALQTIDLKALKNDPINAIFVLIFSKLADVTGHDFNFDFTARALFDALQFGAPEQFTSANGKEAYRVSATNIDRGEMITVVVRWFMHELLLSDNTTVYAQIARNLFDLDDNVYGVLVGILTALREMDRRYPDSAMGLAFWVFFGGDAVTEAWAGYLKAKAADGDLVAIVAEMADSSVQYVKMAAWIVEGIFKNEFTGLYEMFQLKKSPAPPTTEELYESAGVLAKLTAFFQRLIQWFKKLFRK